MTPPAQADLQRRRPIPVKPSVTSPSAETTGAVRLSVSKKYVLPPRPKPGRKPSADSAANRRKVQNREAQRAFRERKMLAVQELEEKLKQEEKANADKQAALEATVERLRLENEMLRQAATPISSPVVSPLYSQRLTPFSPLSLNSPPVASNEMSSLEALLEEKLPVPPKPRPTQSFARSPKAANTPLSRRTPPAEGLELTKTDWSAPPVPLRQLSALEQDFTYKFLRSPYLPRTQSTGSPLSQAIFVPAAASPSAQTPLSENILAPADRCGFCTEGTPCICAEAAARENSNMADINSLGYSPLPMLVSSTPISTAQSMSPPVTVASAPDLNSPTAPSVPSECSGNPGNCNQCQDDPMLTLFCSTIASKTAQAPPSGTFIPARVAYATLSRHREFSKTNFSLLIESLQTRGTQVEVNSVANVLRMLDKGAYS